MTIKPPKNSCPLALRAVDGADMSVFPDTSQVDDCAYEEESRLPGTADFGAYALYQSWFLKNPSIYTFLLQEDQLVGYINAMPLVDTAFRLVLDGCIEDGRIDPDWIRPYQAGQDYQVYLCSIAVRPDIRSLEAFGLLGTAFLRKVSTLLERGIRVREIASVAWTPAGRQICEVFGMRYYGPHRRRGEIYHQLLSGSPGESDS